MTELEDDQVVENVLAGDTDQFALLVKRYQVLVRSYCGQMLGDPERGWDESQEVFLKAYKKLSTFRGESKFSSWLMKIAKNHCIDCSRSSWFRKLVSLDNSKPLTDRGHEPAIEAGDLSKLIINSLQDDQRAVLILREVEGYSYAEIAEILEISQDAVKGKIKRAREKARQLRDELEKI